MENTNYIKGSYSRIIDKIAFFSGNIPESKKLKLIVEKLKIIFTVTDNQITLDTIVGDRIYKVNLLNNDSKKDMFGFIIYIPSEKRLDIWDAKDLKNPTLIVQFKNRKAVWKNYSTFFDKLKLDSLFNPIINLIN